jgi:penicillin-binding protein 1A
MTHRQRKNRRRKHGRSGRSKVLIAAGVLAMVIAIGGLSVVGWVLAVAATAPDLSELQPDDKGQVSVVYAADGSRLGYVQSDVLRQIVPWKDIPESLADATVAIEDERFYEHQGVDFNAIVRAGVRNIESGKTVQGGSTITQQLVRALYIEDPKRDFARKIREAKLASELEDEHSKRWILHQYVNSVPYGTVGGRTAIGVEAATVTFFDKHAKDLELHEAALLAGLPQAPSQYNPFRNPTAALERRNEVLRKMAEIGFITQSEAAEAMQRGLGLKRSSRYTSRREPYFFDFVQEELIEKYGAGVIRRGGLEIHTTINPKLQDVARDAIAGHLGYPDAPSSAVVTIDPATGHVKAMASSGTYGDRTFNLAAQGHRQPGSAFKTMVLTAAILKGVDPNRTSYTSKPLDIQDPQWGSWKVKTYDNSYGGTMSLTRATLSSDNSVYAQLILDLGPKAVCETAKLIGIETKLDCLPAEGLGGLRLGVSPLEMANAYATLAAGGMRNKPKAITKVVFPDGKSEDLGKPERKRVMTDGQAYEVTKILEMNIQSGTGTNANIGCDAAGKTGTTDNFNDAWFVGYTPKLSTAVWVGYPNALRTMPGMAGGTVPAQIWGDYMNTAKGSDCTAFPEPAEPATFSPFFGKYSSTGTGGTDDTYYQEPYTGPGDNSAGGQDYEGYDPRLYESPPQEAPDVEAPTPEATPAPTDGGGGVAPGQG